MGLVPGEIQKKRTITKPMAAARRSGKPSWRKQRANWGVMEEEELARFVGRAGRRVERAFPVEGMVWAKA